MSKKCTLWYVRVLEVEYSLDFSLSLVTNKNNLLIGNGFVYNFYFRCALYNFVVMSLTHCKYLHNSVA